MFTIITGKPGSSKTSHLISILMKIKDRPIYYRGINLTELGKQTLGWHELTDDESLNWPANIPDASILVIDEAQEIFPVRPSSKAVPVGLSALEKHRHRGLDIYFLSQDPYLLDNHARKICNEHLHYSRPFGAPFAIKYHSGSGFINPASKSELATTVQTKGALPRETWGLYKSAEVHTHKFRPPKFIYILILLPFAAAAAAWFGWSTFNSAHTKPSAQVEQVAGNSVQRLSAGQTNDNMSWAELLKPEIPSLPFTAPIYREEATKPKSIPRLAGCVVVQTAQYGCKCFNQRGHVIEAVPRGVCESFIRNGYFDHLIADSSDQNQSQSGRL